ncbi:hypothetical protein CRYUN_Cryun02cG0036600 [Craigia yunnanensis]
MNSVAGTQEQKKATLYHYQQALVPSSLVADLEKVVHKQKEMQTMYKERMERTQDYLSPQAPASVSQQSDLGILINQANMNGWYIDPVECIYTDFFHKNENGVTFFAQEVETLSRQRHAFILRLMCACLDPPTHGWVVTEFLSMTLKDWLHGPGNNRPKERMTPLPPFEERLTRPVEIVQAMQYLHEQKPIVIHREA